MEGSGELRKKRKTGAMAAVLALSVLLTGQQVLAAQAPPAPEEAVAASAAARDTGRKLVPLGRAVGIKLFSDGVMVVGLSELHKGEEKVSPGKSSGLKTGDVITHVNGREVDTVEEVQAILRQEGEQPLTLRASRKGKVVQLSAQAVETAQGCYQLGVWLRDSMAGIGTITYYDPNTGVFAALGHGINDVDTAMLMPMESGSIMPASVDEVKKGISGEPGELHGRFELLRDIGVLYANTPMGVFGRTKDLKLPEGAQWMEVASPEEVKTGRAVIRSNVEGETVQEFEIQITRVNDREDGTKSMMIQVTDPKLLELTGGIVQGMSGSPIIQDGKLVGAVTHVLVNDPTRGYGIFIENMLDAAE